MSADVRPPTSSPIAPTIALRRMTIADLPTLFRQQLDAESNVMAGTKPFTEEVYHSRLQRILADANLIPPTVIPMVIVDVGVETNNIVGTISCFQRDGQDMIGYWIDRSHWGRGIASQALALFIREVIPRSRRPLHAHVVSANVPSMRVLTKCGFRAAGTHAGEDTDRFTAAEVTAICWIERAIQCPKTIARRLSAMSRRRGQDSRPSRLPMRCARVVSESGRCISRNGEFISRVPRFHPRVGAWTCERERLRSELDDSRCAIGGLRRGFVLPFREMNGGLREMHQGFRDFV